MESQSEVTQCEGQSVVIRSDPKDKCVSLARRWVNFLTQIVSWGEGLMRSTPCISIRYWTPSITTALPIGTPAYLKFTEHSTDIRLRILDEGVHRFQDPNTVHQCDSVVARRCRLIAVGIVPLKTDLVFVIS